MAQYKPTSRTAWIGFVALLVVSSLILLPIVCQPDPQVVLEKIPLGSKLSELDKYLPDLNGGASVQKHIPTSSAKSNTMPTGGNGAYYVRDLGEYKNWNATKSERDEFTGEIHIYHYAGVAPDDLAPSYIFWLFYERGILKKKDYGHLPG